jgi:branched-chain amino acid transport system ATP-binding protein
MDALTTLLGTTPSVFVGLTVVLVGGAAILTGLAVANNWKPSWQVVAACFGLAFADRFLTYALFQGELLSILGLLVSFLVLAAMGLAAWRTAKVAKLVGQYPWRYRRTSPFAYEELSNR